MKYLKRIVPQLCVITAVCIMAGLCFVREAVKTNTNGNFEHTVIIDAGHGGLTNTIH